LGEEAARQELIEHNLRLVVYIARRFENTGINIEDLISIGTIGLIKAVGTYRTDKNIKTGNLRLPVHRNEILMFLRKNDGTAGGGLLRRAAEHGLLGTNCCSPTCWVPRRMWSIAAAGGRCGPVPAGVGAGYPFTTGAGDHHCAFGLGGGKEQTQKEVADRLGISQSYISRLEKRIIQRLKKEILRLS